MAKLTLVIAGLIIGLSVLFYLLFSVAEGQPESWTPLIPSAFGVLLAICGALALVGEAFGRPGALDAPWAAQLLKILVGLLLIAYLVLGIRSFIAARRNRAAAG